MAKHITQIGETRARQHSKRSKAHHAAYDPRGRAICPVCWSDLDIDATNYIRTQTRKTGWNIQIQEEPVEILGTPHTIAVGRYLCSNVDCGSEVLVPFTVKNLGLKLRDKAEVLPWVMKNALTPEESARYLSGSLTDKGVWLDAEGDNPADDGVNPDEVTVTVDQPWVFIDAGPFEPDLPKHWTRTDDGLIKTRMNTNRHHEILRWFRKQGVQLQNTA